MNAELKAAFTLIKPTCDVLMACPTIESVDAFVCRATDLKKEVIQELQQYLLFPLITHIVSPETEHKSELQQKVIDAIVMIIEKVTLNSFEMCMKIEVSLLQVIFNANKPGMIADIPEELKLSIMKCLTIMVLNADPKFRETMFSTHVPLLGKSVFVAVHIAKLDKNRTLRLAAIDCVTAHTATHAQLTIGYHIRSSILEKSVVNMLTLILPGVLAALQDVATSPDNPGHKVIVSAIDAMHRILCIAMNNKYMLTKKDLSAEDFAKMAKETEIKEVSSEPIDPKTLSVRSAEWYRVAGEKLSLVTKSLVSLRTHEHFRVRKELAIFCSRLLFECNIAMQTSMSLALDTLISLSKDDFPEVATYCTKTINTYFANVPTDARSKILDTACDNFLAALENLPRVMNNIDSSRKLSALNLVYGYIKLVSTARRPQRLTSVLSVHHHVQHVCMTLAQAGASLPDLTVLTVHAVRDVTAKPPNNSPWCKLRHLDNELLERRYQDICRALGESESADLVLDRLLELFNQSKEPEFVYMINWICSAPNSSEELINRIINTYTHESVWYLPLEVSNTEPPPTEEETRDPSVYNPHSWHKDSVPDLYEGAVETRYTGISYAKPRPSRQQHCTLRDVQNNMLLCCLVTEGLGVMATRLGNNYQPYLLKTLCLVLERVGSKYEMLHLSGLKTLHRIAACCGHETVAELIKCNGDYVTNQVTVRLKKAWNCQSALQILSVVMEYSDPSILNYLYGIVEDVLVQSCDTYYENDLYAYLQVFLSFIECIRKWFMIAQRVPETTAEYDIFDVLKYTREYIDNKEIAERLLSSTEFEEDAGKSVEEMYNEDVKRRQEEELDYDDTVTVPAPPPPQHVTVSTSVIRRSTQHAARGGTCGALALRVLRAALPVCRGAAQLLPLVHSLWAPLSAAVTRALQLDHAAARPAYDLLLTVADLARDFVKHRALKEVFPHIYTFLQKSSKESHLKDVGSFYRSSYTYSLQTTVLSGLGQLVTQLMLDDDSLGDAMACVDVYLSNKQPQPLQLSAIEFFKMILDYDYGAAWCHLRKLCDNDEVLNPPVTDYIHLEAVVGTPYISNNNEYSSNVQLIFNLEAS